ncbi:hypothetical protein JK358_08010 [Nocardia sp. 2]|uniref:Uncharacterized protein n=1 Tax=Nocardia acididurans TaxID=2802282 RepID=A0ABS1M2P4_9NOCA|nr:hypothetical protein [Nocardia acididurans]MBL1074340.1 hypothetical protein [Nocardia acididurans]
MSAFDERSALEHPDSFSDSEHRSGFALRLTEITRLAAALAAADCDDQVRDQALKVLLCLVHSDYAGGGIGSYAHAPQGQ